MPFAEATCDLVWTEHAQMNIADKEKLYTEMARVLKPSGRLAFHDNFQGPGGGVYFPAPWAGEPSISHLITSGALKMLLESIGFRILHWYNVTRKGLIWFRQRVEHMRMHGSPLLGIHLLTGADARIKQENQLRNLEEERIVLIQAVLEKAF